MLDKVAKICNSTLSTKLKAFGSQQTNILGLALTQLVTGQIYAFL